MMNFRIWGGTFALVSCVLLLSGAPAGAAPGAKGASPLDGTHCPNPPAWFRPLPSPAGPPAFPAPPHVDGGLPATQLAPEQDLHFLRVMGVSVERSSSWIPVTIPAGAVGLTAFASVHDPGFGVSIEVRGPSGESLACRGCEDAPVVGEEKVWRGNAQIPSTDRDGGEIGPGTYQFRVNALRLPDSSHYERSTTVADLILAMRSDAGPAIDHVLDLNFVYLPGIPLDAQIASTSPEFAELLELTEIELAPLGIRLGEITHGDLPRPEFTNLGSWQEAARLFQETSSTLGRSRALNVYCVSFFEGDFMNAAGLSGGIPGASLNGTMDSGTAMRIAPSYPNFIPAYAKLLAHEIGHYLGFYHTTEADLQHEDPLSDTPRCESPDLHACPDWTNHMFPIVNMDQTVWSPAQIAIAKTHPMIRTVPLPGVLSESRDEEPAGAGDLASAERTLRAQPNPFVDRVEFVGAVGSLEILDVGGRRVRTISSPEGRVWDGRDARGRSVPPGVYFVRSSSAASQEAIRVIRIP